MILYKASSKCEYRNWIVTSILWWLIVSFVCYPTTLSISRTNIINPTIPFFGTCSLKWNYWNLVLKNRICYFLRCMHTMYDTFSGGEACDMTVPYYPAFRSTHLYTKQPTFVIDQVVTYISACTNLCGCKCMHQYTKHV